MATHYNDAIKNNKSLSVCFGHDNIKVTEKYICFVIGYTKLKLPLIKCQHVEEIYFAILDIISFLSEKL